MILYQSHSQVHIQSSNLPISCKLLRKLIRYRIHLVKNRKPKCSFCNSMTL